MKQSTRGAYIQEGRGEEKIQDIQAQKTKEENIMCNSLSKLTGVPLLLPK
jgi:hypothetical protein